LNTQYNLLLSPGCIAFCHYSSFLESSVYSFKSVTDASSQNQRRLTVVHAARWKLMC